jgi:hypothetical protein
MKTFKNIQMIQYSYSDTFIQNYRRYSISRSRQSQSQKSKLKRRDLEINKMNEEKDKTHKMTKALSRNSFSN